MKRLTEQAPEMGKCIIESNREVVRRLLHETTPAEEMDLRIDLTRSKNGNKNND